VRTFIRIAAAASVVVALVSVLIHVGAVAFANEWDQRGDDTSGWVGVLHGLLASLLPLGFIWLGVFVVYLVVKGRRILEES
jgi:hypothetical protein